MEPPCRFQAVEVETPHFVDQSRLECRSHKVHRRTSAETRRRLITNNVQIDGVVVAAFDAINHTRSGAGSMQKPRAFKGRASGGRSRHPFPVIVQNNFAIGTDIDQQFKTIVGQFRNIEV